MVQGAWLVIAAAQKSPVEDKGLAPPQTLPGLGVHSTVPWPTLRELQTVFAYGLEAEAVESQAASAALQKRTKKPRAGRDFFADAVVPTAGWCLIQKRLAWHTASQSLLEIAGSIYHGKT